MSIVWSKSGGFCGGSAVRGSDQASELGGVGFQGTTRQGEGWLMKSSDLAPAYTRPDGWKEGSQKEQCHLSLLPFPEKVVLIPTPPAWALKLVNLIFPYMFLELFKLLHWSLEQVSLWVSESVCESSVFRSTLSFLNAISAGFHSQDLWILLFPALVPQAGEPWVGLGILTPLEGPPQLRHPTQYLITTPQVWGLPIPCLHSFYWSQCGFFFMSLVTGIPLNWSSVHSQWWLFYNFIVILRWSWEEASIGLTYSAILTGSFCMALICDTWYLNSYWNHRKEMFWNIFRFFKGNHYFPSIDWNLENITPNFAKLWF